MGSSQSVQEEEEEEEDDNTQLSTHVLNKTIQQVPEMVPLYASDSPLSPQLSTLGTPRIGPSIKVWDPYNVLSPPRIDLAPRHPTLTDVYLINHGESELGLRPDIVCGRSPESMLTTNGKRQARALAVLLNSQRVRFDAVYSSPLDRARATAVSACQEMNFPEEHVETSDALVEMSQGQWEGYLQSEIYTPEILCLIDQSQPDFSAPLGESLRQVEFRMVQFLQGTVLGLLHDKLGHHNEQHSVQEHRGRAGILRRASGKSRLQYVSTRGDQEASCVGVFTHSVPIKCLVTGILGCSSMASHRICIDDSSVTVLRHAWNTGWQIKRLNDTAHLRLL